MRRWWVLPWFASRCFQKQLPSQVDCLDQFASYSEWKFVGGKRQRARHPLQRRDYQLRFSERYDVSFLHPFPNWTVQFYSESAGRSTEHWRTFLVFASCYAKSNDPALPSLQFKMTLYNSGAHSNNNNICIPMIFYNSPQNLRTNKKMFFVDRDGCFDCFRQNNYGSGSVLIKHIRKSRDPLGVGLIMV